MKKTKKTNKVYHIPDPIDPQDIDLGYVGVSTDVKRRFKVHCDSTYTVGIAVREHGIVFEDVVIIEDFKDDVDKKAYDLERELRPTKNIGWNIAPGGDGGYNTEGQTVVKDLQDPERGNFLVACDDHHFISGRYVGVNKGITFSEEGRKNISDNHADVSGENNPMFGKSAFENKTEEEMAVVKKNMSDAKLGENNNMAGLVPVVDILDNHKKSVKKAEYAANKDRYFTPNSKVYQSMKKNGEIVNL
ncbi:MAG: hypothetical protein J7L15_05340 [Clostridiales bacterium]|nr:hypothetical protein [Clostridiales bacterium]